MLRSGAVILSRQNIESELSYACELPEDLLQAVSPLEMRSYALATGWRRREASGRFAVFDDPCGGLDQVLVPLDPGAPGYELRVAEAVQVLAEKEGRPAIAVLHDLLLVDADIVRFRITSPDTATGVLPLEQGIHLLAGAKQALLSSACSVITPQRHHPRLARAEAEQLLSACRLGQTERGSFTVAISCPLHAVESGDEATTPFARQATLVLMGSAERIVGAIENDAVDSLYQESGPQPVLSSNFCEALLLMQPQQERASLSLSCSWARGLQNSQPSVAPRSVTFRPEHFPLIEQIYQRLQPAEEPMPDLFVGYVATLNGAMGEDGRMQGEVTLLILREESPLRVRADLGPDDYATAAQAHMAGEVVAVRGALHRGRRVHRLTGIESFRRVGPG
jgi:hypothetical protein